ncbi:unnamed protein product [Blepharisma stoltei]|uniref:cholesterol 7-desaturase n=1 Tax=Blepharisma stoltei TaxID=1481888 RepID=A0AAU9IS21_9CILI|nr:unnamed protein product [Blepharisma stoltei]
MLEFLEGYLTTTNILLTLFLALYILYYRTFHHYRFEQKSAFTKGRRSMGKTLPAFPNGWFCVARSGEIKKGEAKHIDMHGQNIAVFRGTDGIIYAIDAYCSHMGANLAEGGKVKFGKGLQCPFHGWVFDGETGNCVSGADMKQREADKFTYSEKATEGLKKECKTKIGVKKWQVKEFGGFIFVWYHSIEELRTAPPPFEPLDITPFMEKLSYRGVSINKVQSHVQDIPENGGDLMHFYYVHSAFLPFTDLFKARWRAKWTKGDDPKLREIMKHEVPLIDQFKTQLMDRFLTEQNAKYIGVLSLDSYMILPGCSEIFFFNATAFQVGSGLVYLFLKSQFFEAVLFQHLSPLEKYKHEVFHDMWASSYLPYCITALMLRLEAQQVMNDGKVWDNKQFAMSTYYDLREEPDRMLLNWRSWYAQFYEGCREAEEEKERLSW